MIVGLDSAFPPSAAQARAAAKAGVKMWSGYLQSRPNVGLYHPWSKANFDNARLAGSIPIAFCSGWDDPLACRQLAQRWGVRLCLDVEGGIRPNGSWVQAWLDISGAGLYGNAPVHPGRHAAFHVLAAYPFYGPLFPPKATWSGVRPAGPCGWQWRGTHSEFGVGVDRGNYDDWFGGFANSAAEGDLEMPTQEEWDATQARVLAILQMLNGKPDANGNVAHPTPWEKVVAAAARPAGDIDIKALAAAVADELARRIAA